MGRVYKKQWTNGKWRFKRKGKYNRKTGEFIPYGAISSTSPNARSTMLRRKWKR